MRAFENYLWAADYGQEGLERREGLFLPFSLSYKMSWMNP